MRLLRPARKLDQGDYDAAIARGLAKACDAAPTEEVQLDDLHLVVFSDLHRGARDGADDFQRCEPAYCAALGSYLERGFALWQLGDVEELWENDIREVMPCYPDALALERAFLQGPGLRRFFGNHDLDWRDPAKVREHLEGPLPGVRVEEAVRLRVKDGGEELGVLFFVHGHQGTDLSDRGAGISRLALRYVWRAVQRSQGWLSTTPASNFALRHKHDLAMFHWAQARARRARRDRVLLIAGHTHHPVFPGSPPPWPDPAAVTAAREALERAREAGAPADEIARLRGEGERVAAMLRPPRFATPPDDPPCYFNTGCCCFPDGDVTCLEITGGELRLVRWLDDEGRAVAKVLAPPRSLREVLGAISAAA